MDTCRGDHVETILIFPTNPFSANFPRSCPLGIEKHVDSGAKSSSSLTIQTTSLLQVFVLPTLPDVRRFDVDPTLVDVDGNDWKRDGNVACVVLVEALDVAVALGACLALLLDCRKEKHNAL